MHQAKAALEAANVREMELHRMNQNNMWFDEKANFQSESEKTHSEVILVKDSLPNHTSNTFSLAICSYVKRTLIWQLQVKQLQHDLDMALKLHKSEKEEAEYHHLILVLENGELLRETAAEQKTMLEQMESLRTELKMHKDTILPSQHQRMLELASHMQHLQECGVLSPQTP